MKIDKIPFADSLTRVGKRTAESGIHPGREQGAQTTSVSLHSSPPRPASEASIEVGDAKACRISHRIMI